MKGIKRIIVSVSNKEGLSSFIKGLDYENIEILSTGGTARYLREEGIKVKDISEYIKFNEILNGRVKTLHPKIFGGILFQRENQEHCNQIKENEIKQIDMVIVNLYPFEETINKTGTTFEEAIEQIDIGGPSLLRAAAKNFKDIIVLSNPKQYQETLLNIKENKIYRRI